MKRVVVLVLALVLVLSVTGCSGGGGEEPGGATNGGSTPASSGDSDTLATIDDLETALERDHADAEWYGDVTGITVDTMMGTSALVVHVAWDDSNPDYETNNRKAQGISDALFGYRQTIAPNYALMLADGTVRYMGSSSDLDAAPMDDVLALPAAPQTADEVTAWLEAVYGPGGIVTLGPDEAWYGTIQSITVSEEDWGSGPTTVLEVTTSPASPTDVSLLQFALQTTGSPLLANYSIVVPDGSGMGGSATVNGPGTAGWFYLTE
jgi:hypothetical protein